MAAWIHSIKTTAPASSYPQDHACEKMQEWTADERDRRIIRSLYKRSGIAKRHSVISDFDGGNGDSFFKTNGAGTIVEPTTARRNDIFSAASRRMAVDVARNCIGDSSITGPEAVTHVVTISCTGFCNPGADYYVVRELGLSPSVQRYNLGFMGCHASIPGLRMAAQFCEADPNAMVLIVAVELCSLHIRLNRGRDSILANSLFSDGAGAVLVGGRAPSCERRALSLSGFFSTIIPEGEAAMAWSVGDHGFDLALSSYVPRIIGAHIDRAVPAALAELNMSLDDIDVWAIHPGGKAILDRIHQCLRIPDDRSRASRDVLREYGNMSSATILFVLEKIITNDALRDNAVICAMAFGPGLTVEMALLHAACPAPRRQRNDAVAVNMPPIARDAFAVPASEANDPALTEASISSKDSRMTDVGTATVTLAGGVTTLPKRRLPCGSRTRKKP